MALLEESLIQAHEGDPNVRWVTLETAFDLLPQSRIELGTAIATAMAAIAPRIGASERRVIFNPLPWARAEWVDDAAGGQVVSVPLLVELGEDWIIQRMAAPHRRFLQDCDFSSRCAPRAPSG